MARAMEIVKYFCEQKNWKYSNLALQKLLYLTNVIYIGKYNEALMPERFQAWSYGPVCPPVYHDLKMFGAEPVKPMTFIKRQNDIQSNKENEVCKTAVRLFGDMKPTELIELTHREHTGWAKNYISKQNNPISFNDMLEEYQFYVSREND